MDTSAIQISEYVKPVPLQVLTDQRQFFAWRYFHEHDLILFKTDDQKKAPDKYHGHRRYFTTFSGGANIYVPWTDRDDVLDALADDIEAGTPMFYNQIAWEGEDMRLVVDLDSSIVLTEAQMRSLVIHFEETLALYFGKYAEDPIPVFTAKCGPRFKKGGLSIALHMIAHVRVTVDQAKQILFSYRHHVARDVSLPLEHVIIDSEVYKEKAKMLSLRFIYNHKVDTCPLCNGNMSRQLACTLCNQSGRVCCKQTYVPYIYSCGKGPVGESEYQAKHASFRQMARDYSIWCVDAHEKRDDYARPVTEPMYQVDEKKLTKAGKPRKTPAASSQMVALSGTNPAYEILEEFLQGVFWNGLHPWAGIRVNRIDVHKNQAMVSVTSSGSTYCLYAGRDHGTNRIFFILKKHGFLIQRCNSDKGCKGKCTTEFSVPNHVVEKVFGIKGPPNMVQAPNRAQNKLDRMDFASLMKRCMEDDREVLNPAAKRRKQLDEEKKQQIASLTAFYKYADNQR